MRDFQRKRKIRKVLYSKGVMAVLLLLVVLVGKATWSVYSKEHESRNRLNNVETDLQALTLREQKLRADIERLKTPEGIEYEIREQFQVAKPGERMVVLVDEKKDVSAEQVVERSLVSKFFDIFR
ncbi:MAG: hypothetical protein EXS51_01405 [Candidatus Taylorbacteria bacterium]|nr:hypothetical protein [Candidatus Taylorbacteria bacterium]